MPLSCWCFASGTPHLCEVDGWSETGPACWASESELGLGPSCGAAEAIRAEGRSKLLKASLLPTHKPARLG